MSVSKFEILPNEILIHLFENYLESVDIFVIFAHGLNARFTSLVHQCEVFHLDLTNIRKQDFNNCMQSACMFREKIPSLSMSERLSGQMNIFLTYLPTFDHFPSLVKLSLDLGNLSLKSHRVLSVLDSLSMTKIHTLSIKIVDPEFLVANIYSEVFHLPTLRRLVLDTDHYFASEEAFHLPQSNIEYLTIRRHYLTWRSFREILVSAKRLVYLNVRVRDGSSTETSIDDINWHFEPSTTLRTFIFTLGWLLDSLSFRIFVMFLTKMPNLHKLTINGSETELMESDFVGIVPGLLPLLTHFTLRISQLRDFGYSLDRQLVKSVQTPVYIDQQNFNIYKAENRGSNHIGENFLNYYPIFNRLSRTNTISGDIEMRYVWSLPFRTFDNDSFSSNVITAIHITESFPISMTEYKLNHVKFLRIDSINPSLFTWINTFINLNEILELNTSTLQQNSRLFFLLISQMKNLQTLFIDFNFLINNQFIPLSQSMKRLNISWIEHPFKEEDIHCLVNLFPSIEHLSIYTKDLYHVPLLGNFFPKLITLTFRIADPAYRPYNNKSERKWARRFQEQVSFQYELIENRITVWIDQDVFKDSFWHSTLKYRSSLSRAIRHVTKKFTTS